MSVSWDGSKYVYTDPDTGAVTNATQAQINAAMGDNATVPIEDFEALLGKLEGSKMRQQRQKSVEGRRDIYSQGLASMMSNF
jgi:uncharacterized protein YmfQ (DUF2313 family)